MFWDKSITCSSECGIPTLKDEGRAEGVRHPGDDGEVVIPPRFASDHEAGDAPEDEEDGRDDSENGRHDDCNRSLIHGHFCLLEACKRSGFENAQT